jgi:hypothetical protein
METIHKLHMQNIRLKTIKPTGLQLKNIFVIISPASQFEMDYRYQCLHQHQTNCDYGQKKSPVNVFQFLIN